MTKEPKDQFNKKEAERRLELALRGAFKTQPKPLSKVKRSRKDSESAPPSNKGRKGR